MSVLCDEIIKRQNLRQRFEKTERCKHFVVDLVEWLGVAAIVGVLLTDYERAAGVLQMLVSIVQR